MGSTHDEIIFQLIKDENYKIQEDGKILTRIAINGQVGAKWRVAGWQDKSTGYWKLTYGGVTLKIHRIVFAAFHHYLVGNTEETSVINHINGDRGDNRLENLELVSTSANNIHAYRTLGRAPSRGAAKHSWETIGKIRNDRANGYTLKRLKEKYEISKTALSYICSGKTYPERLKKNG